MSNQKAYSPKVRERRFGWCLNSMGSTSFNGRRSSLLRTRSAAPRTLRKWTEIDRGKRAGISSAERDRVKEIERENRELKRANEILRKAAACFAQAELDRRQR